MNTTRSPYCPNCPRLYRPLPGDGPTPSPFLIIGERPGENENKQGRVLVGKTGKELNETYLPLAGLTRADIRACNAVRCYALGNRTPSPREVQSCADYFLPIEIRDTEPEVIILMGSIACSLVPSIRLDYEHGRPQRGKLYDWDGILVPMYHPALGLHESKWMTQILEDWTELPERLYSVGSTHPPYKTDYRIITDAEINNVPLSNIIAIDTESHGTEPFSVQVSAYPGHAYMVLAGDGAGLALLAGRLRQTEGILHNAVHDLDELARLGISLHRVRDTMQEAYHLGNLPQGLKPLVFRLFGYIMTSWEDVVRPHSIEALLCWLAEAHQIAQADLSLIEIVKLKTKTKEVTKNSPVQSLLNRLITHTAPFGEYDPWQRLDEFWRDDSHHHAIAHIEARTGPYPRLGIGNAPLARAVEYACGDADWTGQVAVELARRRQHPIWEIEHADRDRV